jgi:hypothetical protein
MTIMMNGLEIDSESEPTIQAQDAEFEHISVISDP